MDEVSLQEYINQKRQERRQSSGALSMAEVNYITAEEYAAKMHMSANTVRIQCRRGDIPNAIKSGRRWFIPSAPAHSEEEYSVLLQENARLKATMDILRGILSNELKQEQGGSNYGKEYFTAEAGVHSDRI